MKILPKNDRDALRAQHSEDEAILAALDCLDRSEKLLRRSLYEFGSELRIEIEKFLEEPPLIPGTHK